MLMPMCGRFVQSLSWRGLCELIAGLVGPPANLQARYNLAPGQDAAVIRMGGEGRRIDMLRWGLIPSWANDPAIAQKLINARVETVAEKPSFRSAWRARRCLIPANGYFEWTAAGKVRQPWLIRRRDGEPLFLAGLWERWRVTGDAAKSGRFAGYEPEDRIETFTVITTQANEEVSAIHHRMPVLLRPGQFESWLAGAPAAPPSMPPGQLAVQAVGVRVNDPRNDDPDCLLPSPVLL